MNFNTKLLLFISIFIANVKAMEEQPKTKDVQEVPQEECSYDVVKLKQDADLFFKIVTDQHSIISKLKLQNLNDNFLTEALASCQKVISTIQQSKQKQHFINLLAPSLHFNEFFPSYYESYFNFTEYIKNKKLPQKVINRSLLNLENLARMNASVQKIRESSKN